MEQKNDTLGVEDVVFMLLETLKSNGTFDEIRRHCVTDIDAKPTYQNWKQRIESNVNKFLSKVKFTPELNKNTVRERLRKHLLDGRENQDIEEGADRILTQVLAPRSLSIFEPKIAVAVDEYLGIKNEAPPIELNGLKESSTNLTKPSSIEISTKSSMNLIKSSDIEISAVFKPKTDFIPDADNIVCDKTLKDDRKDLKSDKKEKSSSLCKEPKSMNGNQSEDENDTGGSLKQKSCQHKNKTSSYDKSKSSSSNHKTSKKDNSCKEIVEKSKEVIHKSKDVINKFKDVIKSKDIIDKPKDIVNKLKDVTKSKDIVDKPKDIVSKPKDMVDKPKDIVEKSKDNVNKPKDIVDKSKEKSFLSKNSHSNSSSHRSNRTDTKRTKRSLEEKKKSSSLCKEPKLLNGNRSDDESNSGGSSKQKSSFHKNKSSSSDKSKSSSSNHKSSKRDNNSTDVVDKSKDKSLSKISDRSIDKSKDKYFSKNLSSTDVIKSKSKSQSKSSINSDIDKSKKRSLSKHSNYIDIVDKSKNKSLLKNFSSTDVTDKSKIKSSLIKDARCADVIEKFKDKSLSKMSSSSSHKINHTDTKRLKLSQEEKNKSPTNKVSDEEKKLEESEKSEKSDWNDFRSSVITNDEQDAANVLLSMSAISYESSHSEIITENIIFIENSPHITDSTTVNELEVDENSDQTKILPSSDNNDIKNNSQLKSNNSEKSQSLNVVKSLSNNGQLFEKVCSVDIERLPYKDIKSQCSSVNNVEITEEHEKPAEIVVDEKGLKILNDEINLKINEKEKSNECNFNDILKVPKLKLKLLPNQIDSINNIKRKKHHKHKDSKKLKPSKSLNILDEVTVSTNMCDKIDQETNHDIDIIINESPSTLSNQILQEKIENNSANVLDDDKSLYTFKGFSDADAIPCKNYMLLKNVIKTLQAQMNNHVKIDDGFKGFTSAETIPCKHRDNVYAELIKLKESKSSTGFIGFSEKDTKVSIGYKYVVEQLELAKKQNNIDSHQQNVKCGENGIQNGKTFNEVMAAYLYKSNDDNDEKSKENYSKPINETEKDSPTVNNNNHNHDNWVVEQEMKYKLLPVKVKLERLMEYGCNNAKRVSDTPQLPI